MALTIFTEIEENCHSRKDRSLPELTTKRCRSVTIPTANWRIEAFMQSHDGRCHSGKLPITLYYSDGHAILRWCKNPRLPPVDISSFHGVAAKINAALLQANATATSN